ncbi:terpenoid synthase [Ramaria rubella]|nr:terpenoid synthase [Ramaria rubella]
MVSSTFSTSFFRLPDLISHCPFRPAYHKNGDILAAASGKWFENGRHGLTEDMRRHVRESRFGQLAAYCYNECEDHRFRVVCDFLNVLFLLDDFSDDLKTKDTEILADVVMNAFTFPQFYRPTHTKGKEQPDNEPDLSRLTRDYWTRCILSGAGSEVQARFSHNMDLYFVGVNQQAKDRATGNIPSLNTYLNTRRMSSGCKPLFDLIEYSRNFELPSYVHENPLMVSMKDCINDFVAWSNDIFSYNVEQARGDAHNLIIVLMTNYDVDLQGAIDHAGSMCLGALAWYCEYKQRLPSYNKEIDTQIAAYTRGMESWISGSLEWSFHSPRYFGGKRGEIKKHRWVELLLSTQPRGNAAQLNGAS